MDRYYMPLGLQLVEKLKRSPLSFQTNQAVVFILTFLAYSSYHFTRKTMSVIKSSLDPQLSSPSSPGWAPFNGSDGSSLLGELDVAFLSSYALGMYFSGHLIDRMRNQRRIIFVVGMAGSGVGALLFGAGYWANIHSFYYFLAVQILAGLFQSTGWPFLIPVIGNWFAKKNRSGLVMGMWNATSPVGDVSGALIASAILGAYGWGWSCVFSGLLILFLGVSAFLFLSISPESAGFDTQNNGRRSNYKTKEEERALLLRSDDDEDDGQVTEELSALGFIEACKIPGVVPFALSLFFSKLVGYTFLYWLPFYISHTAIGGEYLSSEKAGYLSTLYDIGCMAGRILAGHISDRLRARAFTSACCTYFAIPCLFLYRSYGHISLSLNMILMFMTGMFVSGPFTISAAVSADLGRRGKSSRTAASTVTAIITATGTVGASLGPLLTGYISAKSWDGVFIMLMVCALVSGLLLTRLVAAEVAGMVEEARMRGTSSTTSTQTI